MSELLFTVRKWVKPEDLNQHGTLFGGRLMQWVDEEAAILAVAQMGRIEVATRHISEIDFLEPAGRGDLLELEFRVTGFGRTSVSMSCSVRSALTGHEILTLERIVFVALDSDGRSVAHGYSDTTAGIERLRH